MTPSLAAKVVRSLLIISLLLMVIGSAWHVHNHNPQAVDTCLWCLAAVLAVLVAGTVFKGSLPSAGQFISIFVLKFIKQNTWNKSASRAPPIS